jgi:hypothetical protein
MSIRFLSSCSLPSVLLADHPRPTTRQDSGGGPPPRIPRRSGTRSRSRVSATTAGTRQRCSPGRACAQAGDAVDPPRPVLTQWRCDPRCCSPRPSSRPTSPPPCRYARRSRSWCDRSAAASARRGWRRHSATRRTPPWSACAGPGRQSPTRSPQPAGRFRPPVARCSGRPREQASVGCGSRVDHVVDAHAAGQRPARVRPRRFSSRRRRPSWRGCHGFTLMFVNGSGHTSSGCLSRSAAASRLRQRHVDDKCHHQAM